MTIDPPKYKVTQQVLSDFAATISAKPNLTKEEIFQKFPEFKNDESFLQSAMDYYETSNSGNYADLNELNSKFPEFEFEDLKKKGSTGEFTTPSPLLSQEPTPGPKDYLSSITYKPEEEPVVGTIPVVKTDPSEQRAEKFFRENPIDFDPKQQGLIKQDETAMKPIDQLKSATRSEMLALNKVSQEFDETGASQALGSFNKAVVSGVAAIPKSVAILAKKLDDFTGVPSKPIEEYSTYQIGDWLEKKAAEVGITATDPTRDGFLNTQVPQALGSVAAIVLTGGRGLTSNAGKELLVNAPKGILGTVKSAVTNPATVSGGLQMAVPEYEAAKAAGMNDDEAFTVFLKNYGVGQTEALPLARAFNRISKITGGSIVETLKAGTQGGLEEASQELIQTYLQNQIAKGSYDPARDPLMGMLEAGNTGFFVGFILPGVGAALTKSSPETRTKVESYINEKLKAVSSEQTTSNEKPKEQTGSVAAAEVPKVKAEESVPVQGEQKVKGEEVETTNVDQLRTTDGRIGSQIYTPKHLKGLTKYINDKLNLGIPKELFTDNEVSPLIEYIKNRPELVNKIKGHIATDPVEISNLLDGSIHIEDGHHRANLLALLGVKDIPTRLIQKETPMATEPGGQQFEALRQELENATGMEYSDEAVQEHVDAAGGWEIVEDEVFEEDEYTNQEEDAVSQSKTTQEEIEATAKALEGIDIDKKIAGQVYYHGTSLPKSEQNFTYFDSKKGKGVRSNSFMGTFREQKSPFFFITSEESVASDFANAKRDFFNDETKPIEKHTARIIPFIFNEKSSKVLDLTKDNYEFVLQDIGLSPIEFFGMGMYEQDQMWEMLDDENVAKKLISLGYDAVKFVEPKRGIGVAILNQSKVINKTPIGISEAYHKAKAAGKETDLTRAVEQLLGKPKEPSKPVAATEVPEVKTEESVPIQGEQEVKGEEVEPESKFKEVKTEVKVAGTEQVVASFEKSEDAVKYALEQNRKTPRKSDAKFEKARKSAGDLLDLIGPGLKIDEPYDSEKGQKIIIKAGEVVANYIDAGVTRFSEMVQDIYETYGEKALRALFDAMKKGYGSQMASVGDDVLGRMDDLKTVRAAKIEDFIQEEQQPEENQDAFVDEISSLLGKDKLDKRKIEAIGEKHGITDKNKVKELVEQAIVVKARELSKNDDFKGLIDLYENQPTLSHRTNESIAKQQYSTPAPIAYLMGKYLNLDKVKSALEPSAGNGMLTIVADPKVFTVNEIDEVRLANLKKQGFGEVLNQDGRESFNRDKQYNAVVTNPPFGGTNEVKFDGFKLNELAQIMSANALEAMRDKGKAAIIIGGNNKFDENGRLTGRDAIYFNYLFNKYNVEDVIDVDGYIYRKQGASFPIRIILINGRKTTPNKEYAPTKEWFGKQEWSFEGIQQRIDKFQGNENIQPSELVGGPTEATGSGGAGISEQTESGTTENVPGEQVRKPSKKNGGEKSGTVRSGSTRSGGTKQGGDSGIDTGESTVPPTTSGEGSSKSTKLNESEGTQETTGKRGTKREREAIAGVGSGESTVAYKPVSGGGSLNVSTPASLAQQTSDAFTDLVNEVGDLDQYVMKKLGYKNKEELYKALAAEQVDGVALAVRNIERGTGLIIGDQPGIGKGRQAAAVVRYALEQGLVPIFLTKNPSLFTDIYRDLNDVGLGNIKPFILNAKDPKFPAIFNRNGKVLFSPASSTSTEQRNMIRNLSLPEGTKIILASYSQFANQNGAPTREKTSFLQDQAKGTILIMDESHLASGEESKTGEVFMEATRNAKGVVFLSGTYAKRAGNMPLYAFKTSMREAHIESVDRLIDSINAGGSPLQEILSGILTESGEMIRRERTFKGIEVQKYLMGGDDPKLKADQRQKADAVTGVMREIVEFQKQHVFPHIKNMDKITKDGNRISSGRKGTDLGGVKGTPYFQKVFNVINQLLYAIKAEETANLIISELKAGRKPFLAIRATMESMLMDMIERGDVKVGDRFNDDFSFVLLKGLEGTLRITVKDPQGNSVKDVIPVSDLPPGAQAHYKYLVQKIKNLKTGLSISPIDVMINKLEAAGLRVGEVTGRKYRIVTEGGMKYLQPYKNKLNQTQSYQKYNNGDLDVLIVNRSGSTGVSAHSSKDVKDQTPRTMFVLEAELDISELVQMLFRVNRSGQVNLPKYVFVSSTIPAEERLVNMSQSKLQKLDAQTTSNQKQSSNIMSGIDIFNKYGDQVVYEYLKDNPEIDNELGNPVEGSPNAAGEFTPKAGTAHQITGKIAILSTDKQEHFYTDVAERYQKQIQFLNEAGINDLVIETLPLKAKTLKKDTLIVGKGGRSRFGEDSFIEEVEVNTLKKPMTKAEINHQISELKKERDDLYSGLEEYQKRRIDKINEEVTAYYKPRYEAIEKDTTASEGEKEAARAEMQEKENFNREGKINTENEKIAFVKSLFSYFKQGIGVKFPLDLLDVERGYRPAVFMGFDLDMESEKGFLPSNITLKFAINDSRRAIGIAASKKEILNHIRNSSGFDSGSDTLDGWDQLKKPKDRVKRYIATGNILQALGDPRVSKGKLVKYDTEDGFVVTGILQPEDFDPATTATGNIKVPANKAEYIIRNAQKYVLNEEKTIAIKPTSGRFEIRVPIAKQTGGKFYLDDELTKLIVNGRWDSVANSMQGFVEDKNLKPLLDLLTDKFGISFLVDKTSLEPDKDQPKTKAGGKPQPTPDTATGKAGKPKNQNVKPFNMADRIKEIFKKNGIPINEGYLRKTYNGVYKHMIDGVRVQSLWDLFVASHEMTHAIDKKYKMFEDIQSRGSKKLHDELIHAYENLYPSPKKTATLKERIQEGLAMALEYYIAEPAMVNQDYPEIIKQVFDENGLFYQEQMGQFIKDMEEVLHDYQSLNPEDKINARVKWTGTKKKGGVSTWTKATHMLTNDMITGNMVDQMMGGELRSNAVAPNVTMLRNVASITSNWIKQPFGVKEPPQTYVGGGNWAPTKSKYRVEDYLKKLGGTKDIINFNNWLIARRQYFDYLKLEFLEDDINNNGRTDLVERYNQLSKIVENNNMPKDLAESSYNKFAKQFDAAAEIYDAINRDLVDFMESTGLISMAQADEYRNEKGYASFQRFLEDETSEGKPLTLSSGAKSTLNSLRIRSGSDRQILPPSFSQLVAIGETLRRGQLNLIWKAWADAASQNKEIARYFEPVSIQDIPAGNKDFQPVWTNGERKFYKLGEEAKMFAEALSPDQVDMFNAYLRGSSRLFQAFTTQLYAPFAIMNLSLDATTRFMHTQTGLIPVIHDIKTIGDAMAGLGSWMGILNQKLGSNEFTQYLALGGRKQTLAGTLSLEPLSATERILNRDWVSRAKRGWEKAIMVAEMPVNMTELIGRATEYRRAIKQGMPTNVAMMLAANVAVNFSNKGSLANNYVKSVSYMGAGIQAFSQAIKSAKKNPARMASAIGIMATFAATGAIAVYMLGDDDEKRQLANMEPEEYSKFIFLPGSVLGTTPGLFAIRVPETGGNIVAAAQLYFAHLYMNRPLLFTDFYRSQESALPSQLQASKGIGIVGSWLPQAISPEIQAATNTRFYPHMMPIVPEWMGDLDEYAQYDKYTSRTAKALGDWTRDTPIEISPKKFDFYARAKFGRTVTLIQSLAEAALYSEKPRSYINIFQESDRFMFTGRIYNKFYELREEAKQEYAAVKSQAMVFNLRANQVDEAKAKVDEFEYLHKQIQFLRDKIDNNIEVSDAEKKAIFDKLMNLTKDEIEK